MGNNPPQGGNRLLRGPLFNAVNLVFGQGFANRLFGSKQLVNASTSVQPVIVGGPATYPDVNLLRFIQGGYSANATVYTIVSNVSRKFGSIPRYVYKVDDKKALRAYRQFIKQGKFTLRDIRQLEKKAFDETVVEDTPYANLLNKPNEWQGQDSFYELTCTFYMLAGEAFIYLSRGDISEYDPEDDAIDKLPVLEMFIIPPQYVLLIPDPTDVWGVVGYYFVVNGQNIFMRKNDVIHWRKPNPNFDAITRTHLRGFSPLNAGNKLVTQDDSATDATVAMHQNDGAKGVLYNETLNDLDQVQVSQLRNTVDRKINNRDIKGAVATLQGKWGYLDLGQSSVDMELIKGQEAVFVRICNLFGINPMMFLTGSTYENIQQARKDLITNLVLPMCCSLRDEMNRALGKAFGLGNSYTHDVDVAQLPELQNDTAALATSLQGCYWLTPDEKRMAMNEEPMEDDNSGKLWIPNNLVLMEDAAMTDINNSFTDGPEYDQGAGGTQGSGVPGNDTGKGNNQGLPDKAKRKGK